MYYFLTRLWLFSAHLSAVRAHACGCAEAEGAVTNGPGYWILPKIYIFLACRQLLPGSFTWTFFLL